MISLCLLSGPVFGQQKVQSATKKTIAKKVKTQTITGAFKSTAGVMTPLSCYCGNGGTLTTASGQSINLCFENTQAEIACATIKVKGHYITKTNNPSPNDPCPKGKMVYFKVLTYTCL